MAADTIKERQLNVANRYLLSRATVTDLRKHRERPNFLRNEDILAMRFPSDTG
jgi:hypothetical protein